MPILGLREIREAFKHDNRSIHTRCHVTPLFDPCIAHTNDSFEAWVLTAAFRTVSKRRLWSTAIPAIPIAAAVVVSVVAVAVTTPAEHFAFSIALIVDRRVATLALFAVGIL